MIKTPEAVGPVAVAPPKQKVPFADLAGQFAKVRQEMLQALQEVAESGAYILGPKVAEFETRFA